MIDAKQAVAAARREAAALLNSKSSVEEIERESYRGREVWAITLGVVRDLDLLHPLAQLATDTLQYKRFMIDVETGEMLGMVIREPASR
jgi:hypothetical protein